MFVVSRSASLGGRLERKGNVAGFLGANRYHLGLCAEFFVPCLDGVCAWRKSRQRERAVGAGDTKVRMIENANIGAHPRMDITLERHHDLASAECVVVAHARERLSGVELSVRGR